MEELQTRMKCPIKMTLTETQTCLQVRHKERLVRAPRAAWPLRPRQLKWQVRTICSICIAHYRNNTVYRYKEWVTLTATWDKSMTSSRTMKTWAIETKWAFCRSTTWGTLLRTTIRTCCCIAPTAATPSSPQAQLAPRHGVRGQRQPRTNSRTKSSGGSPTKNSSTTKQLRVITTMKRLSCHHSRCRLNRRELSVCSSYIGIKCSRKVEPFWELDKKTFLHRLTKAMMEPRKARLSRRETKNCVTRSSPK